MSTSGATAQSVYTSKPTPQDPYKYQPGFRNFFSSEAVPGTLPIGQNQPQKTKYELYIEGITGTPFVGPRSEKKLAWLYRIRPSVAHKGFTRLPDNKDLEANFLPQNPKVHVSPSQLAWRPFDIPGNKEKVTFVQGLKTLAGSGDPSLREGLAIHIYVANTSMGKQAFASSDGEMLIIPQQGRLDIQTEFGKLMVKPGEIVVIPKGVKIRVSLPDGPSRGYIQEIYGSLYELPEPGPLGGSGLANPQDFESPMASFDLDQSPWEIIFKISGQLHKCSQDHTPFDVVAWRGNYVPYKYDLSKFTFVGSISKDHIDPSIFCVLTAKSKTANVPLAEFAIFAERWDVASNTFRPPYYHRNTCSEFIATIYGAFPDPSDNFPPGGAYFTTGFCPHGVPNEVLQIVTEMKLEPMRIHEGLLAILLESSMALTVTDYAMKGSGKVHEHNPKVWNNLKANFMNHLDEVNKDLKSAGLPPLGQS